MSNLRYLDIHLKDNLFKCKINHMIILIIKKLNCLMKPMKIGFMKFVDDDFESKMMKMIIEKVIVWQKSV